MRHRLASLLRRLADRLYPDDLNTMTITDGNGKVTHRSSYRASAKPMFSRGHGNPYGDFVSTKIPPSPDSIKWAQDTLEQLRSEGKLPPKPLPPEPRPAEHPPAR